MKKVLFVAKMNDVVKDLNKALSDQFSIQLCTNNANVVSGMIDVVEPDLVLISMIGEVNAFPEIFMDLYRNHPKLPVITIGTEAEIARFVKFYNTKQFDNLIRPVANSDVISAIAKRLNLEGSDAPAAAGAPASGGDGGSAAGPSDASSAPAAGGSGKRHILVVDDNAATLRSIKAMLDDLYDITIVPSGIKAMSLIGTKHPDLILLDYEMPVCDGRQTLEMIRAEEDMKNIPVIFLTGVNDAEHIKAVIALRPAGYLLKPPIKETVVASIEKALAARK